jgi:hypothetical protein
MGELLNLFALANRLGVYPHELRPEVFHSAWSVMCAQPFEVTQRCYRLLMDQITRPLHHLDSKPAKKRYAYSVTN